MNFAVLLQLARGGAGAGGLRLGLTLACIALGVALAGGVHTVHSSALAEIDRAARALAGTADLEVRGPRGGFDDALFARLAALREVAVANPVVELHAAVVGRNTTLRVLGIDALRAMRLQPAFVAETASTALGNAAELLEDASLWLSPAAMARLALAKGDKLRLVAGTGEREYRIAGVLAGLHEGGELAVLDIAAAQAHFGRLGVLSRIELRLRAGVDAQAFRARTAAMLPAGVVVSPAASVSARATDISRAYRVNLDALSLVALGTGAFLVFSTLALQAARRRQELALLRALGVTRKGVTALLAFEGAAMGALGAAAGTVLGLGASHLLIGSAGADLGAGFFDTQGAAFAPDPLGLAGIALLAVAMSVAAAIWVARAVNRVDVAEALRDRAVDLPHDARHAGVGALLLAALGAPLLFLPPVGGLPIGGYGAIALWLGAAVLAVGPLCQWTLGRLRPRDARAALAVAQVSHLPGHLAASVAGIVVSASLCLAMAIMVHSFRVSFEEWLAGVVGADIYVRSGDGGDTGFFSPEAQRAVAALPQVRESLPLRYERLTLAARALPLTLVARPMDARILRGFQARCHSREGGNPDLEACATYLDVGLRGNANFVWITEAARDIHGWQAGTTIELPIAGRNVPVHIAGVVRDYARTWGAVMMPIDTYRQLAGDARANDLAIHLTPGVDPAAAQAAIRAALPAAGGLTIENSVELRRRSLAIFDRSFAVTYALEAIAIAIGLAGVTSSFAALAWSRKREFGVLRFLGLRRRDILAMLALEGAAAGALGAAIGLAAGVAISLVLVHVVNRQSFHWSIEMHWPLAAMAALVAGIVAACALGARASAAFAVRREAVLAVKDDA
jgi:putative ABC transport system permease protein